MIILMSDSKENEAAAANLQHLTAFDVMKLSQPADLSKTTEQLLLVDVDADDKFLRYLEPVSLAEVLLKRQLSAQVRSVVFLISDTNKHKNLFEFARPFLARLEGAFKHPVIAYIPTDLNNYGINIDDFPKDTSFNLELFQRLEDKHLLWEGPNILEWITTGQKAISSSPVVAENIRFGL